MATVQLDGLSSLGGFFEEHQELFYIKGGRWNQTSTCILILLTLIASSVFLPQQLFHPSVCLAKENSKITDLGSNHGFAERQCEDIILQGFADSLFNKYLGQILVIELMLMMIWSQLCIGKNR